MCRYVEINSKCEKNKYFPFQTFYALFFSQICKYCKKRVFCRHLLSSKTAAADLFFLTNSMSVCTRLNVCTRRLSGQIEDWKAKVELCEIEGRHLIATRTCDATRRLLVARPWELEYSYPIKHHRNSWHWCKVKWFCIEPPSHIIPSGYGRKRTDHVFNTIAIVSNFHISSH